MEQLGSTGGILMKFNGTAGLHWRDFHEIEWNSWAPLEGFS
jgi:hypothetical protein